MAKCRSCGAEIDFVKLESGKWCPVEGPMISIGDAGLGSVLISITGKVVKVTELNQRGSFRGRSSHFATCPAADQHRRGEE